MKRIGVMLMIVTALFAGCSTASTDTPESPSVQESVLTTAEQESETMINEEEKVLAAYESMQQAMIDKDIDKLDRIVKDGTTFVQSKSSGYVFRSGLTTIKRQICAQNQKYIMHITKKNCANNFLNYFYFDGIRVELLSEKGILLKNKSKNM